MVDGLYNDRCTIFRWLEKVSSFPFSFAFELSFDMDSFLSQFYLHFLELASNDGQRLNSLSFGWSSNDAIYCSFFSSVFSKLFFEDSKGLIVEEALICHSFSQHF